MFKLCVITNFSVVNSFKTPIFNFELTLTLAAILESGVSVTQKLNAVEQRVSYIK